MVMNYFRFVAEEVREILAALGVRSLAELIGRTHYLQVLPGATPRQRKLDLTPILSDAGLASTVPQFCTTPTNAPFDQGELAERMVRDMLPAIEAQSGGEWAYELKNFNRSIGARLSGEIARRWGNYGMSEAPLTVRCSGNAGQSFGVWNAGGLHLYLEGDANDYVGKGMAAGRIVLRHPRSARFLAKETVIMGNTCLYGATGGELYAAGVAGERFAVRNSGAVAVLEGAGDHCCEYMTGGAVCVLGRTGRQLRRRLHRRLRLCARSRAQFRRPLQPRAHRHQPHPSRGHAVARAAPRGAAGAARHRDREPLGGGDPERPAHLPAEVLGGEAQGGLDRFAHR